MQLIVRLGFVVAIGLGSMPSLLLAQEAAPPVPDGPAGGIPRAKGTSVFIVGTVKKHEGVMPLDQAPNGAPTYIIGRVNGSRSTGFQLTLTGGPVVAGAPHNYALQAEGSNLDALDAAVSGGYVVDVTGKVETPKPYVPVFSVESVKKHEGAMPLDRVPNASPVFLIGSVSGDKEKGFKLAEAGGPIGVQEQRNFALKAEGSALDDLAAAVTGKYLVDVRGKIESRVDANTLSVTGSVSEDGSKLVRAGGPIHKGEHRAFSLSVPADKQDLAKALADAGTGHYLVTVTGTCADGALVVTGVTRFTGVLPLDVKEGTSTSGASGTTGGTSGDDVKTGGLIHSPGLAPETPKR